MLNYYACVERFIRITVKILLRYLDYHSNLTHQQQSCKLDQGNVDLYLKCSVKLSYSVSNQPMDSEEECSFSHKKEDSPRNKMLKAQKIFQGNVNFVQLSRLNSVFEDFSTGKSYHLLFHHFDILIQDKDRSYCLYVESLTLSFVVTAS